MGNHDRNKENSRPIEDGRGVTITKSIYTGESKIKWLVRYESLHPADSGWAVIGHTDTQDYIDNPDNSMLVDLDTLLKIEPALASILHLPVGTDLQLVSDASGLYFVDNLTGQRLN